MSISSQSVPSLPGTRRVNLRHLTPSEQNHMARVRAQRNRSILEDQQYQDWIERNSGKYRQITGGFAPISQPMQVSQPMQAVQQVSQPLPRQVSQPIPRVQSEPLFHPDLSTQQTMVMLPAFPPVMRPNPEDEVPKIPETEEIDLSTLPLTSAIDSTITERRRVPMGIKMNYSNILRLVQESTFIQGCFHGHIPIYPDSTLTENKIIFINQVQ